jgi:hypothetical protein
MSPRLTIGVARQPAKARAAASTAAPTSSVPADANSPITSLVSAGLTFGCQFPLDGSRHAPSIRS